MTCAPRRLRHDCVTPGRRAALSRRTVLLGLSATALAGCAGAIQSAPEGTRIAAHRSGYPPQLRIMVFEHAVSELAFHSSAVIDAPSGRVLYDPAGWWSGAPGQRVGDVTHGLTPALEAAYVQRDYFGADPESWRLHRFVIDLPPDQAEMALARAQAMPPLAFGLCAWGLSVVLAELDEFEDLPVTLSPRNLLTALEDHPDLTHTVKMVPQP